MNDHYNKTFTPTFTALDLLRAKLDILDHGNEYKPLTFTEWASRSWNCNEEKYEADEDGYRERIHEIYENEMNARAVKREAINEILSVIFPETKRKG